MARATASCSRAAPRATSCAATTSCAARRWASPTSRAARGCRAARRRSFAVAYGMDHGRSELASPPPLAVLVVDDDEFVRTVLRQQLTALGAATVTDADSGAAALTVLRERGPFSVVICDLQMP